MNLILSSNSDMHAQIKQKIGDLKTRVEEAES